MENAKKNLVFHFGGGRHVSFPQKPVVKELFLYFFFQMFFSFPRWFAPNVDGQLLPDTPENLLVQGKFAKVPFVVGQTKDEGAFFYRLTLNSFNNGQYDDNFIDHKLPRILPVISNYNSKLYPITRQVRKK